MKVSFDFDGTLSRQEVQDYAKSLLKKGIEVFIITARFNELKKSFFKNNPTNDDLFEICKKIGIKERNIIFCNMKDKSTEIVDTDLVFHLDDCWVTLNDITFNTKICAIDVNDKDWKLKCNLQLNSHSNAKSN
ncbi:HAD family hydrolase [Empedobacter sp. ULE_I145]